MFSSVLLCAQAQPHGSPEQIREELIQIERRIGQANLDCDYQYFQQIEADDFLFTDAAGGTTTKKEDLAGEKDCHKFAGTYDLDQALVRLYGNVAVVSGRVTINGTSREGKPVHRLSRFTDVFVWRNDSWQIVAGHASRIPEPTKWCARRLGSQGLRRWPLMSRSWGPARSAGD